MKLFVVAIVLITVVLAVPVRLTSSVDEDLHWDRFKTSYERVFNDSQEEAYRKSVFVQNLRHIFKHNAEEREGLHTHRLGMNHFGDMTSEEFVAKYAGSNVMSVNDVASENAVGLANVAALPDSVDWVAEGAVTPVANQGQCGSSWAFGAAGALEGAWYIHSKLRLVPVSVQQIMDCSRYTGNAGCSGGYMTAAFQYVIDNKGVTSETSYPYTALDDKCKTGFPAVCTISSFANVSNSEAALQAAVAQQPVSVAINGLDTQFYESGVFTDKCSSDVNHGAMVVGYGTLNGIQYWKIKNSWGPQWGMDGYLLILRNSFQKGGWCGVTAMASYPIV